jgi:hypothetical protein
MRAGRESKQLAALGYSAGKRYADFDQKTDHVAEYGLAALVVGVAAHKLGFFALAAAFVLKFAKVIFIAVAPFGSGFVRLFRRRKQAAAADAAGRVLIGAGTSPAPATASYAGENTSTTPAAAHVPPPADDTAPHRA